MRVRDYEVRLITQSGKPFDEKMVKDVTHVVAQPGETYHVEIKVYRDQAGNFPSKYLRFGLYVDGKDVQYWKRLDLSQDSIGDAQSVSVRFWGFKQNVEDIQSFVFAPVEVTKSSSSIISKSLGSIRVVVFEATVIGGVFNNLVTAKGLQLNSSVPDYQKYADQASVATALGESISRSKESFVPNLTRWQNVSTTPLDTLELRYHTENVLNILTDAEPSSKRKSAGDGSNFDTTSLSHVDAVDTSKRQKIRNDDELAPPSDGIHSGAFVEDQVEEVVAVPKTKLVPMLDLTGDDEDHRWETVVVQK